MSLLVCFLAFVDLLEKAQFLLSISSFTFLVINWRKHAMKDIFKK